MTTASLNVTITKLVVAALYAANVTDRAWQWRFKISATRLARIRQGRASLTDTELERISRATGEPWPNFILGLLGSENEITSDTREILSSLHALRKAAETEAADHDKRQRQFHGLRELIRRKSA